MKMVKKVILAVAVCNCCVLPITIMGEDKITITIDTEDSMSKEQETMPECEHCEFDPSEHDEPHEKLIDKIFCKIKKVVKAGFGLVILVKGTIKVIKRIFRK